jgi:hypothetical protein
MPKGPRGEKRSADVIGEAVRVMRIAISKKPSRILSNFKGLQQIALFEVQSLFRYLAYLCPNAAVMVFCIDKGNFAEPADGRLAFSDRRKPVSMPDGQGQQRTLRTTRLVDRSACRCSAHLAS